MSALASWSVSFSGVGAVPGTDIIIFVRCFYLLSAVSILVVRCIPVLRDRFLDYGARSSPHIHDAQVVGSAKTSVGTSSTILKTLDYVATWRVSHSYFVLFYVASTSLSILWLSGVVWATESFVRTSSKKPAYSLALMTLHSIRRLYESIYISVPNATSTMWIGHFAVGLAFYLLIHVAILAEFIYTDRTKVNSSTSTATLITSALFLASSIWQHLYHRYLAGLVKYTLPDRYGAQFIVAPHYTAECLLYLSLAVLSAPDHRTINMTLLCVLIFVVVNLGITAEGTKSWQLNKFRERRGDIERRWRMLPGLF